MKGDLKHEKENGMYPDGWCYGCTYAYNLDGGGSATLYFNGKVMNKLIGNTQRPCADFLYFTR